MAFVRREFTICAQFIFKGGSNDGLLQNEEVNQDCCQEGQESEEGVAFISILKPAHPDRGGLLLSSDVLKF